MNIIIAGSGRSSQYLIKKLGELVQNMPVQIHVVDVLINATIRSHVHHLPNVTFHQQEITLDFIVRLNPKCIISLLPPALHDRLADWALKIKAHFFTASYMSSYLIGLDKLVRENKLIWLTECGLDPGLDHMSIMQLVDEQQNVGYNCTHLESYCGGLVALNYKNPPWNYKMSWNPMNVVLAAQGGQTIYLEQNKEIRLAYPEVFSHAKTLELGEHKELFDAYANRDSTAYKTIYGLHNLKTCIRGTLRYEGFCAGWYDLALGGYTSNVPFDGDVPATWGHLSEYLFKKFQHKPSTLFTLQLLPHATDALPPDAHCPADCLVQLLIEKWELKENESDRVVMRHILKFEKGNETRTIQSYLDIEGQSGIQTAMAKTVGLPLAYAVYMVLTDKINAFGVQRPICPIWYKPILALLERDGIQFKHRVM